MISNQHVTIEKYLDQPILTEYTKVAAILDFWFPILALKISKHLIFQYFHNLSST